MAREYTLEINGVVMPTPKHGGVKITKNKIWSSNSGRSTAADGARMQGTIIAIKRKVQIEWPPLHPETVAIIDAQVNDITKPFVKMKYTDERGQTTEMDVYFGDPTYTIYGFNAAGDMIVTGIAVSGIEQ